MSPTNEQIFAEAIRRQKERGGGAVTDFIIEVTRENWTPPEPEPVDPDILAFREFASKEAINWNNASLAEAYLNGDMDSGASARLFLAGARMAREQERERAKVLVDYVWEDVGAPGGDEAKARSNRAFDIITKYEKGGQ